MRNIIPMVFFALAGVFLIEPYLRSETRGFVLAERTLVTREDLRHGPPRAMLSDPPTILNGGMRQRCSHCHSLFESPTVPRDPLLQHTHIELDHGLNDRCYNCHSREERDKLVLFGDERVGFGEGVRLCAQCHGTTYRDWKAGIHGRTNGYWDAARGVPKRLVCAQCHDPHAPAFDPVRPLPGPNTLRMGQPAPVHDDPAQGRNPLERWKVRRPDSATPGPAKEKDS